MHNELATVYLSLGSNLGDRRALLEQAISLLGQRVGVVESTSSFIETEPWGFQSEHPFLNAAVRLSTTLTPFELLLTTQQIEREMGRTSKSTPATIPEAATASAPATVPDAATASAPATVPEAATASAPATIPEAATASAPATVPDAFASGASSLPRYHDRPIDIDILLYGETSSCAPHAASPGAAAFRSIHLSGLYAVDGKLLSIKIPHPLMHERDFVMVPLRQILSSPF